MVARAADLDPGESPGLRVLLPGLYTWAATVLYPASFRGVSWPSRALAGLSLAVLLAGVVLGRRSRTLGRGLGLHGFLLTTLLAWLSMRAFIGVDRIDPVRSALGAIGWVIFALGWGAPREVSRIPEDDPHVLPGSLLTPRSRLSRGAVPVLALSIACAAVPLVLAWRITRDSHALFGHAVALLSAVAIVTAGGEIAIHHGSWKRVEPASRRASGAMVPLVLLAFVLLLGLVELLT